jgi:hypothetical protein
MFRSRLALALAVGLITPSLATAAPIQWAGNGHYYDLVTGSFTWDQALATAEGLTHDPDGPGGEDPLVGYLVTITSAGENDFLNANYGAGYWMAASDEAVEGTWRWVAGPESGDIFWQNGATLTYANWNGGEPNNQGDEDWATENLFGVSWNDWCSTCVTNFVVEYSGSEVPGVPEPAMLLLISTGLGGLMLRRRRAARS